MSFWLYAAGGRKHDVTLIDGWQEHVDAIRSKGLFVETETTQEVLPHPCYVG